MNRIKMNPESIHNLDAVRSCSWQSLSNAQLIPRLKNAPHVRAVDRLSKISGAL